MGQHRQGGCLRTQPWSTHDAHPDSSPHGVSQQECFDAQNSWRRAGAFHNRVSGTIRSVAVL